MLRADNDKLRLRIKSLKESQDSKDDTIAGLRAKVVCSEMLSMFIPIELVPSMQRNVKYVYSHTIGTEYAAKF